MKHNLKGRSLLTLKDWSKEEIRYLLDLAHEVKTQKQNGISQRRFAGKSLALLFEKRSTRTRCAFQTAFGEEGGNAVMLSTADIHLGAKESIEDTARVFGRMFDCIQFRGFSQQTAEHLAKYSGIPVYNGLTDAYHPTQALADMQTLEEHCGGSAGKKLVYIGDGRNNVAISLLIVCAKMGTHFTIVAPQQLFPSDTVLQGVESSAKESGCRVRVTDDINDGVKGADVLYTDVWTSMGEEKQAAERKKLLSSFQVNDALLATTGNSQVKFMHCLPAVRGQEVTNEVLDGAHSVVWDEAENRKHTIKALMLATL